MAAVYVVSGEVLRDFARFKLLPGLAEDGVTIVDPFNGDEQARAEAIAEVMAAPFADQAVV